MCRVFTIYVSLYTCEGMLYVLFYMINELREGKIVF